MENINIRNFCIIAHIDHGKSTLADRMLELTQTINPRKMQAQVLDRMDLERERGITIKLQPVRMIWQPQQTSDSAYILNLIDTPGHVDFSYEVSRTLAAVEGAIVLVDATQGVQAQTLANLYQAQKQNLDIVPAINKIDLPNARVAETKKELAQLLKINEHEILEISAKTGQNVDKLFSKIIEKVRPPKIDTLKPLRALIFDSLYDEYRGIVAFARIVDGQVVPNQTISFMATNAQDKALEVGYFAPDYQKSNILKSGEIGYIMTGLKNLDQCKVGDTIVQIQNANIKNQNNNIEPLPGYKKAIPMVYAGFYLRTGEINDLREALEKLSLNDSSLTFEPENSLNFGFGFRLGFLGLLHLEIIKERLEREYNLDLIITSPKVNYQTKLLGGKTYYSEPWVKLEIITPQEYIGRIMELTVGIRGIYLSTEYFGERVILKFEAPLANVITNYYDKLKSASSGYASLNYEFIGYRDEDLLKMDIVIAQEPIEALAQIVHRNELFSKAKNMVGKLKESLPKQMFKVSIQAAVGGKIIAREDIPAIKKDVTGHLYGGDVSRKRKLWEKQKKGKKKMQTLGRVDIPTDIFIKLLK